MKKYIYNNLLERVIKNEIELSKLRITIKSKDDEITIYKQQIKEYESYDLK